jgi:hypothetical protein
VAPGDFLDLAERYSGQTRVFRSDDVVRSRFVLGFEIVEEVVHCTAFPSGITDEKDRRRTDEALRDALVELVGLGNALTAIVCFLAVLEVTLESVRVARFKRLAFLESGSRTLRLKEAGAVMIDQYYRHPIAIPGSYGLRLAERVRCLYNHLEDDVRVRKHRDVAGVGLDRGCAHAFSEKAA